MALLLAKGNAPTPKSGRETETNGDYITRPRISELATIHGVTRSDIRAYNDVLAWIDANEHIYKRIVAKASQQAKETGYCSAAGLLWWARLELHVSIPNHFGTILPRIMLNEYPELTRLRDAFKLKSSKFDKLVNL